MPLKLIRRPGIETWYVFGTVAGRRVREATGTADRRLAEEYRATREAELFREALHGTPAVVTWHEACLSYLEKVEPGPGTRRLLLRLTNHLGRMRLRDIDQVALDRAINALCRPGAAPSTKLRNVIVPLQAVLNHAARRQWCDAPNFEIPEGATGIKRTRWLTPAEYVRLRDASAEHLRPLIVFLCCTGARLGEALALQWDDVDFVLSSATLRDRKGGHGDHVVKLFPAAVAALASITDATIDKTGQRVRLPLHGGPVFRTDDGRAYARASDGGGQIRSAWAGACRRAGFSGVWKIGQKGGRWWTPKDVTPHVLRHTAASWHYCVYRDLLRLRDEVGWATSSQAERYAKLAPKELVPAILSAWGFDPTDTPVTQAPQTAGGLPQSRGRF